MSKTFDEIAAEQGWNADSREQVLKQYIDSPQEIDLGEFAQNVANEENAGSDLPDFQMGVHGEYTGNAYPEQNEYRVRMTQGAAGIVMSVEDTGGHLVGDPLDISAELAEGIITMASTDHGLNAYDGDFALPGGMDRQVFWALGDAENDIRLDAGHIDEIAAWLRYATGLEAWDGGEDWEY